MKIYVLDASVVLAFLLEQAPSFEKDFIESLKQAKSGKVELYSSYLLPLEVGNGLRFSLQDQKLADEALEKFLNLPIKFFVFNPAHYLRILQLAYLLGTSFYDTSYHFLATLLKGVFLTCDRGYFQKAKRLGNIKLV